MRLGYSDVLTKIGIQSIKDKLIAIKGKTVNLQEDKTIKELASLDRSVTHVGKL